MLILSLKYSYGFLTPSCCVPRLNCNFCSLKIKVNGIEEIPLYKHLKAQQGGGVLGDNIKWNFTKFLVDANGKVIRRYKPIINPAEIEVC